MGYIVRTKFEGHSEDGRRRYNFGGGGDGGGGGQNYYANQDKLLGVQADIAQNLYNQYAEYAPSRLQAMSKMADEAMDGTLANRMRGQASADAGIATGNALGAAQRGMERYGTTFNPDRMQRNMTDAGLAGAAMKVDGMNRANQWAENQKWARNSDMYSALSGMPGNAVSALNSAASGYGQMGNTNANMQMAGAQGYGQMGAMIGYGMMKADGGYIDEDEAPRFAMGGMPKLSDWRQRPSSVRGYEAPNPVTSIAAGAAPVVAMDFAKPYLKEGLGAVKEGVKGLFSGSSSAPTALGDAGQFLTQGEGLNSLAQGASALGDAGKFLVTDPAAYGVADAATAAVIPEAATAATTAATAAEGAGALSALGTAAPWLVGGYLLGDALNLWADGGAVPHRGLQRKDMRGGGKVSGPGTETSDSIPAWLSDGEYVLNADAVKEVGKAKLEKMNQKGLKKRQAKAKKGGQSQKKA